MVTVRLLAKSGLKLHGVPAAQERTAPDFIIIGAQRCGSTSLYRYVIKHPGIAPAVRKEIHFFDRHYRKGLAWYRAQFPLFSPFVRQVLKRDLITGEATPYYILHPHAPKRIFEAAPQAKLIAVLRNPVDRVLSHYNLVVASRFENLSFEDAIQRDEKRLRGEMERMIEDENYCDINIRRYSYYLYRGIYVDQLTRWTSLFPKQQVLILRSEDLFTDPPAVLNRVFDFLDLPSWESNGHKKHNSRTYQEMNPSTRKQLIQYFEPHNQRLYEYLGVNLGWDK